METVFAMTSSYSRSEGNVKSVHSFLIHHQSVICCAACIIGPD
jgi:hypothetical protein